MKHFIFLIFTVFFLFTFQSSKAQIYVEEFDTGFPNDWFDYTEAGFDFVSWYGGELSMFKQSDGPEILMLGTELLDLSLYTKWEVDLYAFNLNFTSDTKPYIQLGTMSDPNDANSFEAILVEHITNEASLTFTVFLGAFDQTTHLALKMVGEKSQITYIDNFKLYDEVVEANFPLAVDDLQVTPAPNGELSMTIEWVNPTKEADGDLLTSLESIHFYSDNIFIGKLDNPTIGSAESTIIEIDSSDYYTVKAIPISNGISGYEREATTQWVGLDYPSVVQNLSITTNDGQATLTWTPPIEGGNGGFYKDEVTEYYITRCDGNFISVPGNLNMFTEQLDLQGTINYVVEARNSSDTGDALTSDNIFYVSPDYMYYEDFWVDVIQSANEPIVMGPNQWQTESSSNFAGWSYFTSNFTNTDPGELSFLWSSQNLPNQTVRAISPIINTEGAQNLTIQMQSYIESGNNPFSFFIETTSDEGQTWTKVHEWNVDGSQIDEQTTKVIANTDVGSSNFQFSITYIGNTVSPGFTRFDNIRVFNQPSTDIKVSALTNFATLVPGETVPLLGEIENNSTAVIDCTVRCTVKERFGSGIPFTVELPADGMEIGESRTLDFGTWISEEGEYLVEIEMIYPGGDDDSTNDIQSKELNILLLESRELVLLEDFTGTWCSFCPGAALGIKELMDDGYPIAVIGRHRSDDYETIDIEDRMAQYNVEGFPTMIIDGTTKFTGGDQTESVASFYIEDINLRSNTQTQAQVEVVEANLDGNIYTASVQVSSLSIIQNPNYELRASIIESHIEDEWLGIPTVDEAQRYYSDNIIDLGDRTDFVSLSFTLNDVFDLNNADMVVYLQDINTNEVINATVIDINEQITSTSFVLEQSEIKIYPNPSSGRIYIEMNKEFENELANVALVNTLGQVVMNQEINLQQGTFIDLNSIENGVYFLKLKTQSGQLFCKKINFVK